jgi:hypothetical protein
MYIYIHFDMYTKPICTSNITAQINRRHHEMLDMAMRQYAYMPTIRIAP